MNPEEEDRRGRTEEMLRLLNSAVLQSRESILITDAQLEFPGPRIVFANPAFTAMTGYGNSEIIGKTPRILQGPATERSVLKRLKRDLERGEVFEGEAINYRKDGAEFVIEWQVAPIRDAAGITTHFVAIQRDITERKRSEIAAHRLAAIVESSDDAIIGKDLNGIVNSWNRGAEKIFGYTAAEMIGTSITRLIPADRQHEEVKILETIRQGNRVEHFETLRQRKDGGLIAVSVTASPIRDSTGRVIGVSKSARDITERKSIEAQFMRAQRMESIGTLAGGIAHDLNNILAPIMMSIETLKDMSSDPKSARILDTIETCAKRGADIVRQVLSFARGVEGERVEVQLRHLLTELENIIRDTFPKSINLRISCDRGIWRFLGDPTQVHQILLNLCVNARDAMPSGGHLAITVANCVLDEHYAAMNIAAKPGRYVNFDVIDTGTGIPPAILDKIFEPFFTTKPVNKGTGLGLSTVMAIVKSHGGIVNVYSEPGKGSTFKVYLPAAEDLNEMSAVGAKRGDFPRGRGELVLVVDDEASIRTITGRTLEAFGYRFLTAADGADALAVYLEHKNEIAVVLTDMMMPVMDGKALIHALTRVNPKVKIVADSGLGANGIDSELSRNGVRHFLAKPYTAGSLLHTLRAILDEK